MTAVFLKLLNMSIAASWLVLAVIVVRLFLKKAPSWIVCLLWGIVALRLIMPFTIESPFSLIPSAEVIPLDMAVSEAPAIHSGIPVVNSVVNPVVTQNFAAKTGDLETIVFCTSILWMAGVAVMVLYSAVTYIKLYRQVSASVCCQENVYLCDHVESPFLLGIFRPRIYLPSDLPQEQRGFVLAHENAHIKRRDHLWKPLGFFLLTIYWFNPLLWIGYILLCRDIERACDEKVIANMDSMGKVGYSEALVACSVHRKMVMACPVAFGEISVKSRIKGVLNYKKPVFWLVWMSMLVCLVTAACFLTNPQICIHAYHSTITTEPTCTQTGLQTRVCTHCQYSYTVLVDPVAHTYDSGVVTEPATCTHQGTMQLTCVSCGQHRNQAVAKTAHIPGETVYVQQPDCSHEGTCTATCTQCNVMFITEILPMNHDHDLHETVTKEATCSELGEGILQCSRCDYQESCTYEKLPHVYDVKVKEPTCRSFGWEMGTCVVCGDEYYHMGQSQGFHNFEYVGGGYKECSYCGWRIPSDPPGVTIPTMPTPTPSLPTISITPQFDRWGQISW